jgi:hypothetical protein
MTGFRYFRPASLTWWAGVAAIIIGVLQLLFPNESRFEGIGAVLAAITGSDGSPATLIAVGMGLIGLGDKITRQGS